MHVAVTATDSGRPVVGIEDIGLDRQAGVAYLSADDRRTGAQGGIYALPLAAVTNLPARAAAVALTSGFKADFHPHGIALYQGADGGTLFVVNHRARPAVAQTVEVFGVAAGALTHRSSLQSPLIVSPNDLVADGPRTFYLTNDHTASGAVGRAIADLTGNGHGNVVRYDGDAPPGGRFTLVATGIPYANGIALDAATRRLYVAASRSEAVLEYDLARGGFPQTEPDRTIPLGIGADNLSAGPDGALIVAGHPSLWRFALYALTGGWWIGLHKAPSQVIRLDPGPPQRVKTLYVDDGTQLSAATVGVEAGGLLLVGAVFDPGLVACRL